ncbi:exopolysaccharide Pel transporter PelG [Marinicrinis sediminis]|uniref:Exopolysaccharide Pel transporter PelG n=1 Tax=Marinicrinis sediminis TaxID=1652465 RepID=A0ABW5R8I3_9BACL
MAGIGFELRKLYRKEGLLQKVRAFAFTSFITVGPLISCIFMILGVQGLSLQTGVDFVERELIHVSMVYAFIFSYLITSIVNMFITRYLADRLFTKNYTHLISTFYGCLCLCLIASSLVALPFILMKLAHWKLILPAFLFYQELVIIWLASTYVTAVKHYKSIVHAYLIGVFLTLTSLFVCVHYFDIHQAQHLLYCFVFGFLFTAGWLLHRIDRFFRTDEDSPVSFHFLSYRKKFHSLIGSSFFLALGLYVHQFMYWIAPTYQYPIQNIYYVSNFYDLPVFYGFITVIPSMVIFVMSVETAFYPKYRKYYDTIIEKGTILDINQAKHEMNKVLMQQLTLMMGIQLIVSVICLALGIRFLPKLGFTSYQIDTFTVLVLAFYMFIVFSTICLLLLYFDDRMAVFRLTLLFFVSTVVLTWVSMYLERHGLGFFLSCFLSFAVAYRRLAHISSHIHYYTFSAQPLLSKEGDSSVQS